MWVTAFRTVAATVLLTVTAVGVIRAPHAQFSGATLASFGTAALVYGWILVTAVLLRGKRSGQSWLLVQPLFDPLLAASLVALSGGVASPLWFGFLLSIIAASAVGQRRGALIAAAWSCVLTVVVVIWAESALTVSLMVEVVPQFVAQWLVAILSGYLAEQLNRAGSKLVASQQDLESMRRLRDQIVESMPSGLITSDAEGRISFVNSAARTILAFPPLTPPASLRALIPGLTLERPLARAEFEVNTPNGLRIIGISTRRMTEAGQWLVVFQDLTELRRLEADLKRIDHLAELGRLSATLAHEVRNPLASMRGAAQLLSGDALDVAGQQKLSRLIVREADRLAGLVESYLALARPPPPSRQRLRLEEVAAETAEMLRADPASRQGIDLSLSPAEANVDPDQLKQVLINLLRNAMTAAGPEGKVRLSTGAGDTHGWVEVWDSGGGIGEAERSRLFEPFFSTWKGTGLGLSMVQSIVQAHGGVIDVDSAPGSGTRFRVSFPRGAVE